MLPGITPSLIAGVSPGYQIARSLRFNAADSPYLTRTTTSAGDRTRGTYSVWIKRGALSGTASQFLMNAFFATNNRTQISIGGTDTVSPEQVVMSTSIDGTVVGHLNFAGALRDPSAWMHICVGWDTTVSANNIVVEINGVVRIATVVIALPQNTLTWFGASGVAMQSGRYGGALLYFDGYKAEEILCDGTKYSASNFGQINAVTNVWEPKTFVGNYGPNGSYLKFADNSAATAAALGKDSSGMSNYISHSDAFDNGAWMGGVATLTGGQADPFGGTRAYLMTPAFTFAPSVSFGYTGVNVGGEFTTATVYAKAGSHNVLVLNAGTNNGANASFNLTTGTLISGTSTGAGTEPLFAIEPVEGAPGWYKASVSFKASAAAGSADTFMVGGTTTVVGETICIFRASVVRGKTPPRELQYTFGAVVADKNWTPTNFSVTAGTGNDSVADSPTNNFATLSPIDKGSITLADGNLSVSMPGDYQTTRSTFAVPATGKWWCEMEIFGTDYNQETYFGVVRAADKRPTEFAGISSTDPAVSFVSDGSRVLNGAARQSGWGTEWYNIGDMAGMLIDNGSIYYFTKQTGSSTWVLQGGGAATTGLTGDLMVCISIFMYKAAINFGQRPWAAALPTQAAGAKEWCTQNLPDPAIVKPSEHFDVNLRTGTGVNYSVTGKKFLPELVWVKGRSGATAHALYDVRRGVYSDLELPSTAKESFQISGLTAFNPDGYNGGSLAKMNTNAATYVDWMWKKGALSGFDAVRVPVASAAAVPHALGVKPAMIITKNQGTAGFDWVVMHRSFVPMNDYYTVLNTAAGYYYSAGIWGGEPTATHFYAGNGVQVAGASYIAYLFAEVPGFSRFGSYVGNGSVDGPFVWCGFRPRWLMLKRTNIANSWHIIDAARSPFNPSSDYVCADLVQQEYATAPVDFISGGFKLRSAGDWSNGSGGTYIYAAFAEAPFKTARAR